MRSYNQHCGLAKALDVVGDRWTLLIVRELLIRGVCRYTDLRNGLPGIATNLLADRLKELEEYGVLSREEAPPPIATSVFRLTAKGKELEPAVLLLGGWGAARLAKAEPGDVFLGHWLVLPLRLHLAQRLPSATPMCIEIRADGVAITIDTGQAVDHIRIGSPQRPDVIVSGSGDAVLGFMSGRAGIAASRVAGAELRGDRAMVRELIALVARSQASLAPAPGGQPLRPTRPITSSKEKR